MTNDNANRTCFDEKYRNTIATLAIFLSDNGKITSSVHITHHGIINHKAYTVSFKQKTNQQRSIKQLFDPLIPIESAILAMLWKFYTMSFLVAMQRVAARLRAATSPPTKPNFDYISPIFSVKRQGSCMDGTRVWIYTPEVTKSDTPDVIVYLHGHGATNPATYEGHIEHLVKQGNYVVYPQMQDRSCERFLGTPVGWILQLTRRPSPAKWVKVTAQVVTDVLNELPPFGKVFLYGNSMGGAFAMMWGSLDTVHPVEAAVVVSPQPAGLHAIPGILPKFVFLRLGEDVNVPEAAPNTTFPVVVLHGDKDNVVSVGNVLPSYELLGSTSKAWYQAKTDKHGKPPLKANHLQAAARRRECQQDSLDWRFTWPALDQVMNGTSVTELVFDMGEWSDGTPVKSIVRLY
jgi:pimeloyl-ACP methyl ester carboxylesterase